MFNYLKTKVHEKLQQESDFLQSGYMGPSIYGANQHDTLDLDLLGSNSFNASGENSIGISNIASIIQPAHEYESK
jgi:hypothetical protein